MVSYPNPDAIFDNTTARLASADTEVALKNCDATVLRKATTQDASTSPPAFGKNLFAKRRCSHIKGSHRRRGSSQGSLLFRGHENVTSRLRQKGGRSSSIQSYIFSFWPPIIEEEREEDLAEYDLDYEDEDEEDNLEPGCCNACWDKDVAWCERRSRVPSSTAWKFRAFGCVFCILGAGTFCLQQFGEDLLDPSGLFSLVGGITYSLAGCFTILALWRHAKITLLLQLLLSVLSLLYALAWILAFQVILATRTESINQVGKDMNHGFPWVLAAQYLMAGGGSVMGVLSAALASITMRELKESPTSSNLSSARRKSSTSTCVVDYQRRHSSIHSANNVIVFAAAASSSTSTPLPKSRQMEILLSKVSDIEDGVIISSAQREKLPINTVTECTSAGVFETSFP